MNIIGISGLHNSIAFKKREFPQLPQRLYRVVQGLDSAAALVTEKGVVAAAAEERFSGEKGTGSFPVHAIQYCLDAGNFSLDAIDYIAHGFAYEPYKSFFERTEFGKRLFTEVYSKEVQLSCLQEHFPSRNWSDSFIAVPHHLAHAASAFYMSGFDESLILVADGMGETQSTTIAVGKGNTIEIVKEIPSLHSLGILYGLFTLYLGFKMGSDEYKVMGLAPYGDPSRHVKEVSGLVHLKPDGTYTIPALYRNRSIEERETYGRTMQMLIETFGPAREPGTEVTQFHRDMAAALQATLQASLMHILQHFKKGTQQDRLCMAGGVALNCSANGFIHHSGLFKNIFIQPAAGDDGTALGAALYVQRQRDPKAHIQRMTLPLWGPGFEDTVVDEVLATRPDLKKTFFASFERLAQNVAERLARGQIVAWFQGRMEFGPRALGCRSILADPRDPGMKDHLNKLIKKRENFRPFAPAVKAEAASRFFEIEEGDEAIYEHMLVVTAVRPAYHSLLPAITHIDGSARVQTVQKAHHPRFWTLLDQFEKVAGLPILLNTSFNLRDQPIVCTPAEAIDTFVASEIDVLVVHNYVILR